VTKGASHDVKRAKSRVMVRFGATVPDRTAFTRNVSESGLFLQTNQALQPGTKIQLVMQFSERTFTFWGEVVWAKRVPPQLAHLLECGMGIRFIEPGPEWLEFYKTWKKKFVV
jgi:Tfp pilus assembly protein PilZ